MTRRLMHISAKMTNIARKSIRLKYLLVHIIPLEYWRYHLFFTFLPNTFMNTCWYHHSSIDSTNTWAKETQEGFGHQELTVITADMQTKGRGRQGKPWLSNEK